MYFENKLDELMYQSGLTAQGCWDEMDQYDREAIERYAQMIVLECVRAVQDGTAAGDHYAQKIEQHIDNKPGGVLHFSESTNEYKDYPKWIDTLSKEQQHEWYLWIKSNLNLIRPSEELINVIKSYEERNGLP